jgi:NADH-quinone oxidoreductase subunit F
MLKDKDRIFQNLYNDLGSDVSSSQKRGDWVDTKDLTDKGRDWINNEPENNRKTLMDYKNA